MFIFLILILIMPLISVFFLLIWVICLYIHVYICMLHVCVFCFWYMWQSVKKLYRALCWFVIKCMLVLLQLKFTYYFIQSWTYEKASILRHDVQICDKVSSNWEGQSSRRTLLIFPSVNSLKNSNLIIFNFWHLNY